MATLDLEQLTRTVARIGALTAGRPGTDVHRSLVLQLRSLTQADAVLLSAGDGPTAHRELARTGYPDDVAWHALHTFPSTPWWTAVADATEGMGISRSPEVGFTDGAYYRNHVAPAGFHDGLSLALRQADQYVGMLHLSTRRAAVLTADHQHLLAGLGAAIATTLAATSAPQVVVEADGARAWGDERLRRDAALVEVVAQIGATGGSAMRITWPTRAVWWRLLVRVGEEATTARVVGTGRPAGLTRRELDVLTGLSTGAGNARIAEDLGIGMRTVHTHVDHVLAKLGAANRTAAAVMAVREGLLRPDPDPARLCGVPSLLPPHGR